MANNKVDEKDIKQQNAELENAATTPEAVVSKFEYYKQKAKKQLGDVTNTVVTKTKETKKKIAELREQRLKQQEQRLEEVKRNIAKLEPDVASSNKELVEQLDRLNETLESQTDVLDNLNDQIGTQVQANETFVKATDANIAKMIGHVALNVTRPVAQTGKRFSQELAEEGIYYQKPGAVGLLAARIHPLVGFAVEKAVESVDWTDIRQNVKSKISEYLEKRREQREKTRQYILSETLDEENETPEQPEEQVETPEEFESEEQPEETITEEPETEEAKAVTAQSVLPPSVENVVTKQPPQEVKAQKEPVPTQTPEVQTPEITRTQASVEHTTLLTKLQDTAKSILDSIVGKTKLSTQQESKSIYERLDSIIDHLNNIRTSLTAKAEEQLSKIKPETKPEEQDIIKQIQQLNAQIAQAQIQIQAVTKLPQQVQQTQPIQPQSVQVQQPVTQAVYTSAQVQLAPDIQQQLTNNFSVISTNLIGLSDKFDQLRKQMSTGFTSVTLAISNSYTQALTGFREKLIEAVNESPVLKSMVSTFNIMSNIFGGLSKFFLGKLSSPYVAYLPRRGNIQEKQYTVLSMIYCVLEEIGHLIARIVSGMEAIWHVDIPIPPAKPLALTTKTIPKAKVIAKWLKARKSKVAQTTGSVLEKLTTKLEERTTKSEESFVTKLLTEFVNPITDRIEQTVIKKEQAEETVTGKLNKFIQEIDKSVKVQGETIAEQLDKKYQQKEEKSTKTIGKIIADTIQKPLTKITKFKEDKLTKTLDQVSSVLDKQQDSIQTVIAENNKVIDTLNNISSITTKQKKSRAEVSAAVTNIADITSQQEISLFTKQNENIAKTLNEILSLASKQTAKISIYDKTLEKVSAAVDKQKEALANVIQKDEKVSKTLDKVTNILSKQKESLSKIDYTKLNENLSNVASSIKEVSKEQSEKIADVIKDVKSKKTELKVELSPKVENAFEKLAKRKTEVAKTVKESKQYQKAQEKSIQLLESISKKTSQITKIQQEEYRRHKLQDIKAKLAEKFKKAKRKPSVIFSWLWKGIKSLFGMGGGLLKWLVISFIPLLVKNFFRYGWRLVKNIVTAPFKVVSKSASLLKEGASKLLSVPGKVVKIFASGVGKVVSSALGILSHPVKWIKQGASTVWKTITSPFKAFKEARAAKAVSGLTRGLATADQAVAGWGKGVAEAEGIIGKTAKLIGGPLKLAGKVVGGIAKITGKAVGGAAKLGGRGIAKVVGGAARLVGKAGKFAAIPGLISAPIMAWSGYKSITHEELTKEWEKKLSKSGLLKRAFLGWWDPAKTLITFYRTVKESIQTRKQELEMEKKGLLKKVDESQTFMDKVIRGSLDIMIKIGDISKSVADKFKSMGKSLSEKFTKFINKIKDITEPIRKVFKVIIDKMKDVARAIKKALLFLAASPFIILFKILSPITKIPIVGKGASAALNILAKVLPNGVEQVVRRHVSYLQPNAEETKKATEQPNPETKMQAKTSKELAKSAKHLKTTAQKSMQQMQQTVNTVAATIVNAPSVANVTQNGGSTVVHRGSSPFHADI